MTSKNAMNIGLVSQEYPPETARGGIGSQTLAKAKGLVALGHKVFVISRSIDAQRYEQTTGNICVIRIPGMETAMPNMTDTVQWLTHSVAVAAEITALQQKVKLDIIDFPEWAAEGYVYLLNRTNWNRVPTVVQLHGPLVMFAHAMNWPEIDSLFYRYGTQMEAACVQLADAVYSSSACSTQWIQKYYDSLKTNIPTIHTGVDTQLFSPDKVNKNDHPTIVFAGKFVQNKGVEELVEAASRLVRDFPALRLRMVGKIQENIVGQLKAKASQWGAPHLLEFPGYMDQTALAQEFSRAHVFAAPSYYEGGPGFVYLEAMACGLPVVGCSGSGVEEIVASGKNGYLVPPRDVHTLYEALRKLLGDPAMMKGMGDAARRFVILEVDSHKCIERLESFYRSVIKREQSGAVNS